MTGEKGERGRKSQDKRGSTVVVSGSSQTCEKMSVGGCACPGKYRHSCAALLLLLLLLVAVSLMVVVVFWSSSDTLMV